MKVAVVIKWKAALESLLYEQSTIIKKTFLIYTSSALNEPKTDKLLIINCIILVYFFILLRIYFKDIRAPDHKV